MNNSCEIHFPPVCQISPSPPRISYLEHTQGMGTFCGLPTSQDISSSSWGRNALILPLDQSRHNNRTARKSWEKCCSCVFSMPCALSPIVCPLPQFYACSSPKFCFCFSQIISLSQIHFRTHLGYSLPNRSRSLWMGGVRSSEPAADSCCAWLLHVSYLLCLSNTIYLLYSSHFGTLCLHT